MISVNMMQHSPTPLTTKRQPLLYPQTNQIRQKITQLARSNKADQNNDERERQGHSPEYPLVNLHIAYVVCVHA
jgi:hypothetical protein